MTAKSMMPAKELPGWNRSGYDDTGWQPADVVSAPAGQLCAQPCPPIRVMERVRPVSITRMPSGKYRWIWDRIWSDD